MLCSVLCGSLFITSTWIRVWSLWVMNAGWTLPPKTTLSSRLLEFSDPMRAKLKKKAKPSKLSTHTYLYRISSKWRFFVYSEDPDRKAKGRCRRIRSFSFSPSQLEIHKSSLRQHYVATFSHYSWRAYSLTKFLISWFIDAEVSIERGDDAFMLKYKIPWIPEHLPAMISFIRSDKAPSKGIWGLALLRRWFVTAVKRRSLLSHPKPSEQP